MKVCKYDCYTSSPATFVVAALDSLHKKRADYVCDGVDDQIVINQALDALPGPGAVDIKGAGEATEKNQGGRVVLLEGAFNVSEPIDLTGKSNVTLEGQGTSTVINNLAVDGSHAVQALNSGAPKNRVWIKNLLVQGNTNSGDGIHLEELNYEKMEGVSSQGNGGHGIFLEAITMAGGAENHIISNCQCLFNKLDGLRLETVHDMLIHGCHLEENYRYNLSTHNVYDFHIDNCSIEDGHGSYEIYITNGRQIQCTNLIIEGDVSITMNADFPYKTIITNCHMDALKYMGGINTRLYLSNSIAIIRELKAKSINVANSKVDFSWISSGVDGYSEVAEYIILSGVECMGNPNHIFRAMADNVHFIINGCVFRVWNPIFDGNSKNWIRTVFGSNSTRLSNFAFKDIAELAIGGNSLIGPSTLTVEGTGKTLNISGNVVENSMDLTILASHLGAASIKNNVISSSSLTDETGNAEIYKPYVDLFMDALAASTTVVHTAIIGTGAELEVTTGITNPDVPRNISITNSANSTGGVVITGVDAKGNSVTDTITIVTGGVAYGVVAFATVSKITIPAGVGNPDTIEVGISDKLGLSKTICASGDVYKVKVNNADDPTIGTVNTTYGTLDGATINAADDITIWYKSNLNTISQ